MRSILPTLSAPPNSLSLRNPAITATCARFSSSCAVQPPPYWNSAPNIEKKPDVVTTPSLKNGCCPGVSVVILPDASAITAWRPPLRACSRFIASVYVMRLPQFWNNLSDGVVLFAPSGLISGANKRELFCGNGSPDKSFNTVNVVIDAPMPRPSASTISAVSTRLRLKLRNRSEEHTSELQSPLNLVCRL